MIQIKNAADIVEPWTCWFIYGDTGSGKTHAAGTFPNPFFICPSNEGSILTLQGRDVDYAEVDSRNDMNEVITYLETQFAAYEAGDDDAFPWETIVIESLSHYCDVLIEDISGRGLKKMDMQLWGVLSGHLRTMHSRLRNIGAHIIYTSLAKVDDNGRGQALMVGGMATKLPSACDVLAFMEELPGPKGKLSRFRMHFSKCGHFPARARLNAFGRFPDSVTDFHFNKIARYLGVSDNNSNSKEQSNAESHQNAPG